MRLFVLVASAALCLAAPVAYAADTVFPKGSRIGLVPPSGMNPTEGIAGFQDPKTGAAIVAMEMPAGAYPNVAASLAEDRLKAQGFTPKSREQIKVGTVDAILVSGEQTEGGRTFPKSILLANDVSVTALVVAQVPPGASASVQADLKAALKTVRLRDPLSMDEQMASLPFRIGDLAGFRPVRVIAGNSVMMTVGAKDQIIGAEQPVVIIAQAAASGLPPDQRDAFARSLLAGNTMVKDVTLERSQNFRQGGGDWHEIVAKGKDGTTDEPILIMQTIRFGSGGYVRTVGIARIDQRDDVLPRVRRIVDSLGAN